MPRRPRFDQPEKAPESVADPAPVVFPVARKAINYSDLEAWMAHADEVIRQTRHSLDQMPRQNDADSAIGKARVPESETINVRLLSVGRWFR